MSRFRNYWNHEPQLGEIFEVDPETMLPPDRVNRAGYIPIQDRLYAMQVAGQNLQDLREKQYPAPDNDAVELPLYSDKMQLLDEFREATNERFERWTSARKEAQLRQKEQEEQDRKDLEEHRAAKALAGNDKPETKSKVKPPEGESPVSPP